MSEGPVIGVIGGSGLYDIDGLTEVTTHHLETPFGEPSDELILGRLSGAKMVFLPRHGRGHRLLPSEVNYRANIYAMKTLGVEQIISVSAVGSMQERIVPGHIVVPDQFFDRTKGQRAASFFGQGVVGHIQFADPVCAELSTVLAAAATAVGAEVHRGGTYLCIEGPNFSTRAESQIYRSWGVDVIGMTNIPEARLAREAEICYGTLALATDYDCWHDGHDDVSVESVVAIIHQNVATARAIIKTAVERLVAERNLRQCHCADALKYAIMTEPERIPQETRKVLEPLIGRYLAS